MCVCVCMWMKDVRCTVGGVRHPWKGIPSGGAGGGPNPSVGCFKPRSALLGVWGSLTDSARCAWHVRITHIQIE